MEQRLTRRQEEIFEFLRRHADEFAHAPTLTELCEAMGLSSRGSMHKQIQALVEAGLVEPMNNQRRGIRLTTSADANETTESSESFTSLPLFGYIAAGGPIEAISGHERVEVPPYLRTNKPCYVLEIKGDSMVDEGILDGDWVVIEKREQARNGEIVVALIDEADVTLKRIEQRRGEVALHPANASHEIQRYSPDRIRIQGILVGQMRRYH